MSSHDEEKPAPERDPTDLPEPTPPDVTEQQGSVVWGARNEVKAGRRIRYRLGESTFTIRQVRKGVISVNEEETDDPPFLATAGSETGYVRMGHERGTQPIVLRFPRPILLMPGASFACYSTYPTTPALHYELEDGSSSKLLELPGIERKKTYYGSLTDGVLSYVHYGEHVEDPDDLPDDPRHGVVHVTLRNESPERQEVGIVLISPGNVDYYVRDERLCLGKIRLRVQSETEGDVEYLNEPSLEGAELVDQRSEKETHRQALDMLRSVMGESEMKEGF